ncbi:unnamed protein product [Spirodela intermedia]|uniref:BHLH domain-containing protein n=1 Tax=Spirodela intermedia TaxID=51605 RepID=A0A7I8IFD3_SPIIN|nr:unnamed protein product [Spirodela intermedia]CAA6656528.1 unnamed protein product [Spirodela intermedia]
METTLLPDGIFGMVPLDAARTTTICTGRDHQDWEEGSGGTEQTERMMLKVPKVEKQSTDADLTAAAKRLPFEVDCGTLKCLSPGSHRLPALQSLEPGLDPREKTHSGSSAWGVELGSVVVEPSHKRFRSIPAATPSSTAVSFPSPHPLFSPPHPQPSSSDDQRALQAEKPASRQRKGISERIRLLAKLMPWDRKMNTSTMLEEARNYVKFLEAQVTVLQCMPVESRFSCPPPSSYATSASVLRGLERLTRQQLLHVMVRSPLVQDKLCGRGLCVFSVEQVILMRQAAERKKILHHQHHQLEQQMILDSGSTSTISD